MKSRSSSRSVRSLDSSRRDSDSDEENAVFEITPGILEEVEEDWEAEDQSSSEQTRPTEDTGAEQRKTDHSDDNEEVKAMRSEPMNDQETAQNHQKTSNFVADDSEDITLVGFTTAVIGEEGQKHEESVLLPFGNLDGQVNGKSNLEEKENCSHLVTYELTTDSCEFDNTGKDTSTDENLPDISPASKPNNEEAEVTIANLSNIDTLPIKANEDLTNDKTQEAHSEKLNGQEKTLFESSVSETNASDQSPVRRVTEDKIHSSCEEEEEEEVEEEVEGGKEEVTDQEEDLEGEAEAGEMGKKSFSFLRKKKQGVLKYSSGEFHEQYEGGGKNKTSAQSSNIKEVDKATKEKTIKNDDAIPDEEQPSMPLRRSPDAEEMVPGRSTDTEDISTGRLGDEDEGVVVPQPAPRHSRRSLTRPVARPRISTTSRNIRGSDSDESSEDEDKEKAIDDVFKEEQSSGVGIVGAVVTRLDSDGEEEVIIGPSTSTQTAFADQDSMASSSADASLVDSTEGLAADQGEDAPFPHYATIEPVEDTAPRGASPVIEITSETSSPAPARDITVPPSENQSMTMSVSESEPISDSTEMWSQTSEHAVNKPWDELAAVTVAVTSMPEPLVPEFTHVSETSSTTSSASSLMSKPTEQQQDIRDLLLDDGPLDDTEEEEKEEGGNLYDKVDIYDESYKNKDWQYRENQQEINAVVQPAPENGELSHNSNDAIMVVL